MKKYEDFGEKIGGAHKDIWAKRGYMIKEDLNAINEHEYIECITKNNIWPNPNYLQIIESTNMAPVCALFMKYLRDALPAKLKKTHTSKKEAFGYIQLLTDIKETCLNTITEDDLKTFLHRAFIAKGYLVERTHFYFSIIQPTFGLNKGIISKCLLSKKDIAKLKSEVLLQGFPLTYYTALKGCYLTKRDDNYVFYHPRKYPAGYGQFASKELALEFARKEFILEGKIERTTREKQFSFTRPQLEHIRREGPRYRNKEIQPQDLLNTFGFRGGEFGNWNTSKDRQACLNYTYDAFCDLAHILDVPTDSLSLGGPQLMKLAIAFGSRGRSHSKAHYEHDKVVINLTKFKGAGNLAYNFGHALNDFIGQSLQCQSYIMEWIETHEISDNLPQPNYHSIYRAACALHSSFLFKPHTKESFAQYKKQILIQHLKEYLRPLRQHIQTISAIRLQAFDNLLEKVVEMDASYSTIIRFYENTTKHRVSETMIYGLGNLLKRKNLSDFKIEGQVNTQFYQKMLSLDCNHKSYYSSSNEMFARCFEAYIQDQLTAPSDYLVYGTEDTTIYPYGEERTLINHAMASFLKTTFAELFETTGFKLCQL